MSGKGLLGVGVPSSQPVWLLYIKLAVLVLSLVVLALSAYVLSVLSGGAASLDIFIVRTQECFPYTNGSDVDDPYCVVHFYSPRLRRCHRS